MAKTTTPTNKVNWNQVTNLALGVLMGSLAFYIVQKHIIGRIESAVTL